MASKQPGVWGIDLGQCALKAVRLEMVEGKIKATAFDYVEHPKILSQPDADPDELTRMALEKFLERNELKGDMVAISVPGQSGLARFVKLPPVEEKKIDDIVRFEAKQQIPFPLEEVVWDYQKIGKPMVTDGFAMETEIGLFAMKRDMVNLALSQFSDVKVEVHEVQMAPLALVNFVAYDLLNRNAPDAEKPEDEEEDSGDRECIVALDIGADSSNLVITDGDRIIWQRPIPMGGNRFTRDLTRELKLTFAKAEHIKRNAAKSQDLRKILLALRSGLNEFVNEVQRSLGYFTNTHRNKTISYMVGLGNAFRLPGLQKFLQEKLQLEVRKLSQMKRLEGDDVISQPQFKENILSFGVAYGLALQGLKQTRIQTNLLPSEIHVARLVRAKKPWAVATAAALLLAIAGYAYSQSVQYGIYSTNVNKPLKTALDRGKSAQDLASGIMSEYQSFVAKVEESKKTVNRIASGVVERHNWNLLHKYVNDCLPQSNPANPKVAFTSSDNYPARKNYVTPQAKEAYQSWLYKLAQSPDQEVNPEKDREADIFIKKHMVQINVEGVSCLYSDDLSKFFDNIAKKLNADDPNLKGLSKTEADNIKEKKALPTKGWVFEIRGYTFWQPDVNAEPKYFITRTFVENLRNPSLPGVGIQLSKDVKARVKDKMSYVFMYTQKKVANPTPGRFELVAKSKLPEVISAKIAGGPGGFGGSGAPSGYPGAGAGAGASGDAGVGGAAAGAPSARSNWKPLGEIASAVLSSGANASGAGGEYPGAGGMPAGAGAENPSGSSPAGAKTGTPSDGHPPRTEFIIMFVWQEPFLGAEAAPAASN